jgi:transcription termination factor Rho
VAQQQEAMKRQLQEQQVRQQQQEAVKQQQQQQQLRQQEVTSKLKKQQLDQQQLQQQGSGLDILSQGLGGLTLGISDGNSPTQIWTTATTRTIAMHLYRLVVAVIKNSVTVKVF